MDFQAKQNALIHNCDQYELVTRAKNTAVIRRGGTFDLELEFNQDVDLKNVQELTLYFNFGKIDINFYKYRN